VPLDHNFNDFANVKPCDNKTAKIIYCLITVEFADSIVSDMNAVQRLSDFIL